MESNSVCNHTSDNKKSDDRAAGVRFVKDRIGRTDRIGRHEVLLPINHKNYNFREKKNSQVMKEREICINIDVLTKEA